MKKHSRSHELSGSFTDGSCSIVELLARLDCIFALASRQGDLAVLRRIKLFRTWLRKERLPQRPLGEAPTLEPVSDWIEAYHLIGLLERQARGDRALWLKIANLSSFLFDHRWTENERTAYIMQAAREAIALSKH
jgi:hypothetical protein